MDYQEKYPFALPKGTILNGEYIIDDVLGQGGFGITYKAVEHRSNQRVAIKEYMPEMMATRSNNVSVVAFTGERGEHFEYGKQCFLGEAKILAEFIGNERIVRVIKYFEENGTAYFVMDYVEGKSFEEYLKEKGGKISFEEVEQLLSPVMDALDGVHKKGIIHRDITPDNIFITKEGVTKILDFGAARYSLGDKSHSLDVVLKHGYAPKEQYMRRGRQGPFTDVYSMGATIYVALTGKLPPDSIDRLEDDNLVMPSTIGVRIPEKSEDALEKALSVNSQDRFQSMRVFRENIFGVSDDGNTNDTEPYSNDSSKNEDFYADKEQSSGEKTKNDNISVNENPDSSVFNTKQIDNQETVGKKTRGHIGVIAGIVALILIVVILSISINDYRYKNATIKMPDLVGLSENDAVELLESNNLTSSDIQYEYSNDVKKGLVISQNISPEVEVKTLSSVGIVISKGALIVVPDIVGKSQQEGEKLLEKEGFSCKVEEKQYSDDYKKGEIISQKPKAKKKKEEGAEISIVVSKGVEQIRVPDVVGLSEKEARSTLEEANLRVEATSSYSDSVASGIITSQSIPKDSEVDKGSCISLVVSLGSKPVVKQQPTQNKKSNQISNQAAVQSNEGAPPVVHDGGFQ